MRLAESPAPVDRAGRRELWRVALPLTLYVLAAAASVGVAAEPSLSAFEVAMLAQSLLVFLYVATALRDRREILFAVTVLMVGLALEGALALWVLLGGPRGSLLGLKVRVDADGAFDRFGGTVGSPNAAAAYFGLLLVVALGMLVAPVGKGRQRIAAAALALGGLGLVLTFGRGGWLAFVVSLAVFVVLARRRGLLRVRLSPWAAACLIILALAFGGLVGNRLTSDDANAAGSRVPLLHTAGQLIRDHPVLGVGANNYIEAAAPYRTRDIAYTWNYTVHNEYALVWSETGLLGLVSFVWFLIATVLLGIRCSRLRDPALATLGLAMGAAVLGHMVHMTVEILNGRGSVQGLWLLAGLVAAIAAVGTGEREGRSSPAP
jgi:putative inorganic carbon (hco3(-)) transporter